jgi:hypothetical protein
MAIPSDCYRGEFHGVVLSAHPLGRQQKPQYLRIRLSDPTGHEIQQQEHQQPTEQAVKQVEGGRTQAHGEEKELSLGPEDRQGPGKRAMHSVDSSSFGHAHLRSDAVVSIAGKKPREEIDGGDGHANTEKHAGKHTLRATFTKSERKTSHNNGHK